MVNDGPTWPLAKGVATAMRRIAKTEDRRFMEGSAGRLTTPPNAIQSPPLAQRIPPGRPSSHRPPHHGVTKPADASLDIYLIAIGGTGMAPIACLLKEAGHRVRGADGPLYPPMSTLLDSAGIEPGSATTPPISTRDPIS